MAASPTRLIRQGSAIVFSRWRKSSVGRRPRHWVGRIAQVSFVHRDIKPSNLLLDAEREVKIADFGLAQVSGSSSRGSTWGEADRKQPGTYEYSAPEQRGHPASETMRSSVDIYAAGCVLFELLTNMNYYNYSGTHTTEFQQDIPPWLDELVARMVAEQPNARPRDGRERLQKLRDHPVDAVI